jgi:hypothetical protein
MGIADGSPPGVPAGFTHLVNVDGELLRSHVLVRSVLRTLSVTADRRFVVEDFEAPARFAEQREIDEAVAALEQVGIELERLFGPSDEPREVFDEERVLGGYRVACRVILRSGDRELLISADRHVYCARSDGSHVEVPCVELRQLADAMPELWPVLDEISQHRKRQTR